MTIRDNILKVQDRIQNDPKFAGDFRRQAIEALHAGIGQPAWNTYMSNFVDSPTTATTTAQLARLTNDSDDLNVTYLREARAYLLGNAICIPGTITGLPQGIGMLLDQ
jgi:hypothetical protein